MLFTKQKTEKQKNQPKISSDKRLNTNSKIKMARDANKKAAHIFKGVFNIATMISDFDLRLSFFSGKIKDSSDNLSNMFSKVAYSSEEISISTNQIVNSNSELSDTIGRISEDAEILNENTEKSNEILKSIKSENTEMMVFSNDMDESIRDLLIVIHKINEAVKGINKISDQTKLLSLNASIEAAKAGVYGKGFGVVADEIRTLSDTTKKLTVNIDELLIEMNNASNKSKSSVEKTIGSIGKISGSIESVSDVMAISAGATGSITSRISEAAETSKVINESLQESSTALESVNEDIQNLSRSAEELKRISDSINGISISIANIEENVNGLAIASGEMVNSKLCGLSNEDFVETIENAIKAHNMWLMNVKNMAKDMAITPIQTDEHKCGFGHFYYAVKPSSEKLSQLWESVEELHHALHKTGDQVIRYIREKNSERARASAAEAEKLSSAIIDKFSRMIKIAKEMTASDEFVF
ncbi:methyl-accepting chemotaxis protein [Anaerovorax odorimutans]|uniref:methyl-accepting chemotaxis protein n=1 Tax=Anaerovorax odorimutans TaxID=109327 RepID=UPI00040A0E03|nr:methyl-accepting chemotaxis protein [Anaerovorax odorimutans]